jgi:hypothetical protein
MAYPNTHPTLKEQRIQMQTTSIGGTPVACYRAVPFRGRITKLQATTQGTITTADCTLTVAINGTTNANLAGTIPVAGAATPQIVTWYPATTVAVSEDDYITITPSGASGASIGCVFDITLQAI